MKASIVIPTYNACERLYNNLIALNRQDCCQNDFEVLVVDNGSLDGTWEMLNSFKAGYPLIKIRLQKNQSRAEARNIGIKSSKGDIIIFHDSDMLASKQFVKSHLSDRNDVKKVVCGPGWMRIYTFYYADFKGYLYDNLCNMWPRYKALQGQISMEDRQPLIKSELLDDQSLAALGFSLETGVGVLKKIWQEYGDELMGYQLPWRFFVTNNCSVQRSILDQTGLFDSNFRCWGCEDLELGYRLFNHGCTFEIREEALSYHQEHPIDFADKGTESIIYFTSKHMTLDVLLFYHIHYLDIDNGSLNSILEEAGRISKNSRFAYLVELCRSLLVQLREVKMLKKDKKIVACLDKQIQQDLFVLKYKHGFRYFPKLLQCLHRAD